MQRPDRDAISPNEGHDEAAVLVEQQRRLMRMRKACLSLLLLTALGLSGCGYRTGDRALSGGLLGAGAGAGIGALTGGNVGAGALIGGAAGAAGGALTSGRDVNLGRPAWR
jgi:hypothetical protein